MDEQQKKYIKDVIVPILEPRKHATLSTMKGFKINSRFMIFACSKELDSFYFMANKESDKIDEIKKNSLVTAAILSSGYDISDYSETIISGDIKILDDFDSPGLKKGLRLLRAKSDVVKDMKRPYMIESTVILELVTKEIVFRFYKDVLQNVPRTSIRF